MYYLAITAKLKKITVPVLGVEEGKFIKANVEFLRTLGETAIIKSLFILYNEIAIRNVIVLTFEEKTSPMTSYNVKMYFTSNIEC